MPSIIVRFPTKSRGVNGQLGWGERVNCVCGPVGYHFGEAQQGESLTGKRMLA